jgi:tetratricopeptide (TPR) repeat protein
MVTKTTSDLTPGSPPASSNRPPGKAPAVDSASDPFVRTTARPPNPYILTPLTESVGFYGRDSVLQFVRNTLASPYQNVIVLYGQRRIGKTSVLHQLTRRTHNPEGFRAVYFDLQGRAEHRMGQVLFGLAREIARTLRLDIPPREAFDEESFFQYGFLPQVYKRLGGDRLLVLVDEFDVLGGEEVTEDASYNVLFSYLQDLLIDEQHGMAFVFVVGRRIDELPSRIKATFKSAQCKRISVLDREAATRLVTEPAEDVLTYTPAAVETLLNLTIGHPYFLQLLCYELFDRAVRDGRTVVRPEDIDDEILEAAMELGMGGLAWFWDEFPPAERFILSAIAHLTEDGRPASLEEIGNALRAHGVRLQGMELSTAPRVLADWDIIEPTGRDTFRFRVEFLRRWILGKHSLEEAKRELEAVSARAVRIYESARKLHSAGELPAAMEDYRRALAANPNHARAQLGLAQALYEAGNLETATEAFEKAYRLDPESARDGLLSAHRDLGAILENESQFDQARPHYQRILDIHPDDLGAKTHLRDCWRATAGAHLAAGRWERATEAYREALHYMPDDPYLQQAVATLEQRHLEAEALQRRRQQLERAVLESRLKEEQSRRERLEWAWRRTVPTILLVTGAAVIVSTALVAAVGTAAPAVWPIVVGTALMTIYATYVWATRQLR